MFFLVRGMVEVVVQEPDGGGERLQCTLKEGSWFGEVALVKDVKRIASVRSVTLCTLFRLDKAAFHAVVAAYPQFAKTVRDAAEDRMTAWPQRTRRRLTLFFGKAEDEPEPNPFVPATRTGPGPIVQGKWRQLGNAVVAVEHFKRRGLVTAADPTSPTHLLSPDDPRAS